MKLDEHNRIVSLGGLVLVAVSVVCAQSPGTKPIYPIVFKAGSTTSVVEGTVGPPRGKGDMRNSGSERYSLKVKAGQQATIEVSSNNNLALFTIVKPSPAMSKYESLDGASNRKRWSGKLGLSGDYIITVYTHDLEHDSRFKLRVALRQV